MDEVKVSIITPVYNSGLFLERTIQSVIQQTYTHWEWILVDDHSIDNSKEIITKYAEEDARIKSYFLNKNSGAGPARNIAIENASGRIIAFLDSDDIWKSDKLEKHVEFMLKNKAAFSHTSYGFIDENDKIIHKTFKVSNKPVTYKDLLKRTEISCLTAMYDLKYMDKMYMPNLKRKQDYGLWLSILKKGIKAIPFDEELAFYRQRKGASTSNKLKLIKKHWNFLYRHEHLGVIKTAYYTFFWITNGIKKYYLSRLL